MHACYPACVCVLLSAKFCLYNESETPIQSRNELTALTQSRQLADTQSGSSHILPIHPQSSIQARKIQSIQGKAGPTVSTTASESEWGQISSYLNCLQIDLSLSKATGTTTFLLCGLW